MGASDVGQAVPDIIGDGVRHYSDRKQFPHNILAGEAQPFQLIAQM
jgi:hypothetical protein